VRKSARLSALDVHEAEAVIDAAVARRSAVATVLTCSLQTPRPRFGGRSPVQAIEAGEAELVALSVESALEGHPD
jgi:hypothetical protein